MERKKQWSTMNPAENINLYNLWAAQLQYISSQVLGRDCPHAPGHWWVNAGPPPALTPGGTLQLFQELILVLIWKNDRASWNCPADWRVTLTQTKMASSCPVRISSPFVVQEQGHSCEASSRAGVVRLGLKENGFLPLLMMANHWWSSDVLSMFATSFGGS